MMRPAIWWAEKIIEEIDRAAPEERPLLKVKVHQLVANAVGEGMRHQADVGPYDALPDPGRDPGPCAAPFGCWRAKR